MVTRPGSPSVCFLALERDYFAPGLTLADVAQFRWPVVTGQTPEVLEGEKPEAIARKSGYWRREAGCILHRGEGEHYCWERSAIEDLYQAEGGDLGNIKKGPIPVAKLRALDARLLDEWKKQLVFLAKVRSLYVSCEAKIAERGQEFARRYAELHSATWEAVDEVVGLPPPEDVGLEFLRMVPPPATFRGAAAAELGPKVLVDFPPRTVLPRHIARWIAEKLPVFSGLDWTQFYCLYHKGRPDIQQTRLLVERQRLTVLATTLPQCFREGRISIPMQWRALIRYEGWPFKGNTKSGVNQVLALALGMGDQHGRARDYEVANTNVLWAAATSLAWEEKLNDITPEGTYIALFSTNNCHREKTSNRVACATRSCRHGARRTTRRSRIRDTCGTKDFRR